MVQSCPTSSVPDASRATGPERAVILLLLLLSVLLALHHWLLEPLINWGTALLDLRALPWLSLAVLSWLLAGSNKGSEQRR